LRAFFPFFFGRFSPYADAPACVDDRAWIMSFLFFFCCVFLIFDFFSFSGVVWMSDRALQSYLPAPSLSTLATAACCQPQFMSRDDRSSSPLFCESLYCEGLELALSFSGPPFIHFPPFGGAHPPSSQRIRIHNASISASEKPKVNSPPPGIIISIPDQLSLHLFLIDHLFNLSSPELLSIPPSIHCFARKNPFCVLLPHFNIFPFSHFCSSTSFCL